MMTAMTQNSKSPFVASDARKQKNPDGDMTIGQLAKQSGLSRSALLYYDKIGLLKPSGRSSANYRRYAREDIDRLQLIRIYRQVGIPVTAIREILQSRESIVKDILEKRLLELGKEIGNLRDRQHTIIRMLGDVSLRERIPVLDKESWVSLLRAAGLDDEAMERWHREFEKFSPQLHQEFLEGLGIPGDNIALLRKHYQV